MTLGFSVEALLPHGRSGARLQMGLRRIGEGEWLFPDVDRETRVAVFDAHPDAVRILPGGAGAGEEVAALVGATGGLADAARAVWEDLCILQRDDEGVYRLTAAAVAFPTDWRLAEKMGAPLAAIHAPIHGYAEQLSAGVDHFIQTLPAGPIYARANWFVVPTDAWRYLPQDDPATRFAHVAPDNAGDTLFVRCERQTLRRLPETGAILFTIGVAVSPLGALSDAAQARVLAGTMAQGDGEQGRRAAPFYATALAGYVAAKQRLETA
ncbi:MAG: heme-dependent oxidative N-demethylase family protein [Sphingomonas sp.]